MTTAPDDDHAASEPKPSAATAPDWKDAFSSAELQAFAAGFAGLDPIHHRLNPLASRLIQGLCRDPRLDDRRVSDDAMHRNRSIFTYWDQPVPPPDVAACIESWSASGLRVQRYDRGSAEDFLRRAYGGDVLQAFQYAHHPAMQADVFRLGLLHAVGRLYVDADDGFSGHAADEISGFGAGAVAFPLAQSRVEQAALSVTDAVASFDANVILYLNNAPLFCTPRHRLVELALANALRAVHYRKQHGQRCDFHNDIGPGCLTYSTLQYAVEDLRQGGGFDLRVRVQWPAMRLMQPLAYKQTPRNWRSRSEIGEHD